MKECPQTIANVLIGILRVSLLHTRAAGWSGDADLCATLTDHVHNLPGLLLDFSPDRLDYYWDTERPLFISRVPTETSQVYEALWEELSRCGALDQTTTTNA